MPTNDIEYSFYDDIIIILNRDGYVKKKEKIG